MTLVALVTAGPGRVATPPGAGPAIGTAAASWAGLPLALWAESPTVRALGVVLSCLLPVAILHLARSVRHEGREPHDRSRAGARLALTGSLVAVALAVFHVLTRDPFRDVRCLVHCRSVPPVIDLPWVARGTATALVLLLGALAIAGGVLVLRSASGVGWTVARTTSGVLVVCAALEAAWWWLPSAGVGVGPLPREAPLLLELRGLALTAVALGLFALVRSRLRRRDALRALAREITEVTPPRSMSALVAARLSDPGAVLQLRVPEGWVDEDGGVDEESGFHEDGAVHEDGRVHEGGRVGEARPADGGSPHGQVAVLSRAGQDIARVRLTRPGLTPADLEDALGPAALLALDAQRVRAEQSVRLRELREIRRLTMQASDQVRRRAERDLHDGAQHLLLAAMFELREAHRLAAEAEDLQRAARLDHTVAIVSEAAEELRRLAHGIYPVLLGDVGLVPALESLCLLSPVPVTVDATEVPRLDPSVELTAYRTAALALAAAGTAAVHVTVSHGRDRLVLDVAGSRPSDDDARALADRAAALGGTFRAQDDGIRLELPCA